MSNRKRQKSMNFRVSEAEYQKIISRMEINNITDFSAFAREMMIDGDIVIISNFEQKAIKKMLADLGRIGNNINQIARFMNITGELYKSEVDEIMMNQTLINTHLRELIKIHQNKKIGADLNDKR